MWYWKWQWKLLPGLCFLLVVATSGCPPIPDDDDDGSPTPTEETPTPEELTPTPLPLQVTISGTVLAVDRESGDPIDTETYLARAGVIVVYALPDPTDLVHPIGKATLEQPGFYSMDIPANSGAVYVVAAVDMDGNRVISPYDMLREALLSPLTIEEEGREDIDVILDLAQRGSGGTSVPRGIFAGDVIYDAEVPAELAVVAFRGDFAGWYWGMTRRSESGEYSVSVGVHGSTTSLIGYADADGNGVFEPSDPAGLPENNPYPLTEDGMTGIDILIEGIGPDGLPVPIPYVSVSGTVSVDESYVDTPIVVRLTGADGNLLYASRTLDEPGDFTLRVPGGLSDVTLTGITDSNGDGVLDSATDANATLGPFDVGTSSVGSKNITLELPTSGDTGFSGTIQWNGAVNEGDRLVIALFTQPSTVNGPSKLLYYDAAFPAFYEVTGLEEDFEEGSESRSFYVAAALDVGGDFTGEPASDDIMGAYTTDGSDLAPIACEIGKMITGIDFSIDYWSDPSAP